MGRMLTDTALYGIISDGAGFFPNHLLHAGRLLRYIQHFMSQLTGFEKKEKGPVNYFTGTVVIQQA